MFHEIMHAVHLKAVGRKIFGKTPKDKGGGKEHIAFELVYRLLGKWMRPDEMAAHARRARQAGVDPTATNPSDPRLQ